MQKVIGKIFAVWSLLPITEESFKEGNPAFIAPNIN